jgi:hypothetical protein
MGTAADGNCSWLLTIAPAIGAGLLLAFSRTLWSFATIAEVYTLNAFLILTVFFLMLRWWRRVVEDERSISVVARAHDPSAVIADYDFCSMRRQSCSDSRSAFITSPSR